MKHRWLLGLLFFIFAFPLFCQQTEKKDALKLYRSGKYTEAISVCREEIEENNKNIDSYVVLCWALVKNGQYREAEYWGTEARKISDSAKYDHRIIEILGEAKYYLGNNDAALSLFQEYVSQVSSHIGNRYAEAYYFMGEIYIREARFNYADIALTTALTYENLNDLWWTRLGYAREMAKNYTGAEDAYNRALKLTPSLTDAASGIERISKYIKRY